MLVPNVYTGHSLRSTAITAMSDAGLTDRSIMFMSDHKCEESLKSYCRRPSTVQKYKISSVLDNVATGNSSSSAALVPVAPSTSTAISPIQNNVTDTGQSVLTERTPLRSFDMDVTHSIGATFVTSENVHRRNVEKTLLKPVSTFAFKSFLSFFFFCVYCESIKIAVYKL
ncbi:unnamed protein product [Mytilus coruscus]|uniref:Uncharacterized protein n=1 Tax=Mytilus coruscus TaxID=42192 RepID=A0A6J8BMD5_MYTCO|nr:unnamed protein product [Mytilus coruscus]